MTRGRYTTGLNLDADKKFALKKKKTIFYVLRLGCLQIGTQITYTCFRKCATLCLIVQAQVQ